jgi:broad specificity phosphatase PhoE
MTPDEPIYHLTFLRHGESVGNAENRMQGHADFPLSEKGRAQARALLARWQAEGVQFDTVITSPLSRARETAEIIAAGLNIPNLELEPLWLERDHGKPSGLTMDEIRAQFPLPDFINPFEPVGETGEGDWPLYLRAGQALHKILQRPPGSYLVASHGGILNQAFYAILGLVPQANSQGARFRFENTAFARFRYYPRTHRWRVDVIGDTGHLRDS